jgi:hypothetical protein
LVNAPRPIVKPEPRKYTESRKKLVIRKSVRDKKPSRRLQESSSESSVEKVVSTKLPKIEKSSSESSDEVPGKN